MRDVNRCPEHNCPLVTILMPKPHDLNGKPVTVCPECLYVERCRIVEEKNAVVRENAFLRAAEESMRERAAIHLDNHAHVIESDLPVWEEYCGPRAMNAKKQEAESLRALAAVIRSLPLTGRAAT